MGRFLRLAGVEKAPEVKPAPAPEPVKPVVEVKKVKKKKVEEVKSEEED